jgi:putative oxidoreductase
MAHAAYAFLVVRVGAALLFFQHGAQKLFGFTGSRISEDLFTQRGFAGVLETVGPALLILGLLTRSTAFILSGEMAVAYFMAWAPVGFWPITNGGEEAVLFCFFFLWMFAAGPGALSVDHWLAGQAWWRASRAWADRLLALEPHARAVLRIMVGFLIVQHGARKAFGLLPVLGGRSNAPPLAIDGLPAVTGYLDLGLGALLILGLWTRPAAALVALELLVAYLFVAAARGPWPITNGGGEALLHVLILVCLIATGPGAWSLDRRSAAGAQTT